MRRVRTLIRAQRLDAGFDRIIFFLRERLDIDFHEPHPPVTARLKRLQHFAHTRRVGLQLRQRRGGIPRVVERQLHRLAQLV
jgi:hypothetical protein